MRLRAKQYLTIFTAGAVALIVILSMSPAFAQRAPCFSVDSAVRTLTNEYGESPAPQAFVGGQGVLEFWSNEETGSWTVVLVMPNGSACLLSSGSGLIEPISRAIDAAPGSPI